MAVITTEIKDTSHFLELTAQFDREYQTTTYSLDLTLKEVFNYFYHRNPPDHVWCAKDHHDYAHRLLKLKIGKIFTDNQTSRIELSDDRLSEADTAKMNTIYNIKCQVFSGGKITDPISVSAFANKSHPVHPGGSRLILSPVYHEKVPVILTCYRDISIEKWPIRPIEELKFDFKSKQFTFLVETTKNHCSGYTYKMAAQGENLTFKQAQNTSESNWHFSHPKQVHSMRRTFQLLEDKFYINDLLIAELNNSQWEPSMKEEYLT